MACSTRTYRRRLWICFLLLSLAALGLAACSPEAEPPAAPSGDSESTVNAVDEDAGETDSADLESDVDGLKDLGKDCREHRYLLPAGTFETLEFSKLLAPNQNGRPTTFEEGTNELDETGVHVSLDYVDYQTITREYPVWAFDYSSYLDDIASEIERRRARDPNFQVGVNALQVVVVNGQRLDLTLDTSRGYFIVQRLSHLHSAKAVGALSREEIAQMLGLAGPYDALTTNDKFLNRSLSVPLVESTMDEALTFMTYSVSVNTPAEGGIRDRRLRAAHYLPDSGSGQGISVGVTSSWAHAPDPNALFFAISGPAEHPECYEADAF